MESETGTSATPETRTGYSLKATNVPVEFFKDRDVAKKYFRRFGKVRLMMFKPKRLTLIIEYSSQDSMLNALELAGEFDGKYFDVMQDKSEIHVKKKRVRKDPDPDWVEDPEVRSELEAMGGYFTNRRSFTLRSDDMVVDSVQVEPSKAVKNKLKWRSASPSQKKKPVATTKEILSDSTLKSDLLYLIKSQAQTVEEKYRILDARDKLVRLQLKKNNLTKISATQGTCPDMCPEKERLMREVQHQIALYEQDPDDRGVMIPRLAVKQYSRSSADQEAPLPSELRPVHVLQMTMGYLMHRILGLCETPDVNIAEWYHFLWDRTRGIRKDITQQELCCRGSVELVEQCARFHILCSARLVSEDPSVFDQKINTENLTKCLQTLKYMYNDLSLKGESCPDEPEFRAYIILLNLNDGNFMWEVQQLKTTIQQSQEVRFALDIYSSLDKNNYVKFFKLVTSTTYLNACILMRYFIQVRLSALKTLLKCYSPRISQASIPLNHLTRILAFETVESTVEFLESYGLYTNLERSSVVLDRRNFAMPEYPYALDRAINLVESKRRLSVGEVVCGRQLPEKVYERHQPQNSFDDKGFLLRKNAELFADEPDSGFGERVYEKATKATSLQVHAKESKDEDSSGVAMTTTTTNVFGGVISQNSIFGGDILPLKQISKYQLLVEEERKVKEVEELKRKQQELEEMQKIIQQRKDEEQRKLKRLEEDKIRQLKQQQQQQEARRLLLIQEEERRKKAEEQKARHKQKQKEEEELHKKKLEAEELIQKQKELEEKQKKIAEINLLQAVNDTIDNLLVKVEEKLKTEALVEIRNKIEQRQVRSVFKKWRETTRKTRKRKALDFSPSFLSARTPEQEALELKTISQDLTLSSIKRYKLGLPLQIFTDLDTDLPVIDLHDLTFKILTKRFLELTHKIPSEIFWKVSISLPDEMEYKFGLNFLEKVLGDHLNWSERNVLIQQSKCVTYCLEKQKGALCVTKSDSGGFVFFADRFNHVLCERILNSLKGFGVFTKIPVVLALQSEDDLDRSKLDCLIDQGVISDYLVVIDEFTSKNIVYMLEESLIFLAGKLEKPPPLQLDTLKNFLTINLGDLWKRAASFAKWNTNYKNCLKEPNTVIYIYNEAIDRLKKIVLNRACAEFPKFPEIFRDLLRSEIPDCLPCDYRYFPSFWCHNSYFDFLQKFMDNLKIPKYADQWPPKDHKRLEVSVLEFCARIFKSPDKVFYKMMSVLLKHISPDSDSGDFVDLIGNIVWTEVIEVLIAELLDSRSFSLYGTGFVNKSIFNQLTVVYDVNSLHEFTSDWFYVNHPIVNCRIFGMLKEQETEARVVTDDEDPDVFDLDVDQMLKDLMNTPRKKDVGLIKSDIDSCKSLLNDLEDSLVVHKRILERSGGILKNFVEKQ